MNIKFFRPHGSGLAWIIGPAGVLALAACASTPPAPTASFVAASSSIGNAEKADAGHYAAPELSEAREKLKTAETELALKHMTTAEQLAQESGVEADLATARAAEVKAKAVNDEMKQSNQVLGEELQRTSGGQP